MTALANVQSNKKSFATGSPLDQWITRELARKIDVPIPSAAAAADSVFTMATDTVAHTGGNFTLTAVIRQDGGAEETFTTGNIAYNAAASAIESAIDTAASGVTSWTNADISVAAGATDLQDGNMTITCDGASVTERQVTWTVTDSRTGGTSGANTQTTAGQLERSALAVLLAYGVITGTLPDEDAVASNTVFTKGTDTVNRIPANIVKALMREAAAEDANNSAYVSLEAALYPQDRAPMVQPRTTNDGNVRAKG